MFTKSKLLRINVPKSYTCYIFSLIVCGSVVNNTLKSPGYPNNYPNSMDCIYVVPIPQGTTMNIFFHDFDVEDDQWCRYDKTMLKFNSLTVHELVNYDN